MAQTAPPTATPMDPRKPATMETSFRSRAIGALEELPILEAAQKKLTAWLQPVVSWAEENGTADFLHGRWIGHALHPIATDASIGFWMSGVVLDLVGARRSARLMTAAGCASSVVTAASGIADWTVTDGRARRLGLVHGSVNVVALACETVAALSPRHHGKWSRLGFGIAMASAYLGGELVHARAMMVNHNAWLAGPKDWTATVRLAEIPVGLARGVDVDGRRVLLYREGRTVSAMEAACAHLGGPLDEGDINDGVVTCPWHGSRFRLSDGALLRGPSTFPQLRLQTRVRDGIVEVRGRTA